MITMLGGPLINSICVFLFLPMCALLYIHLVNVDIGLKHAWQDVRLPSFTLYFQHLLFTGEFSYYQS